MIYLKTFEELEYPIYKIGDYVMYNTMEDSYNHYGKIIDISHEDPEDCDIPDDPTFFYDVISSDGKIKSVWQTKSGGEIKDYWNITPEQKKDFETKISANKYNL